MILGEVQFEMSFGKKASATMVAYVIPGVGNVGVNQSQMSVNLVFIVKSFITQVALEILAIQIVMSLPQMLINFFFSVKLFSTQATLKIS